MLEEKHNNIFYKFIIKEDLIMSLITTYPDKCIKCGLCVNECPENVLTLGKNVPEEVLPEKCIACGHCAAICPREAIDNKKTPLNNQTSSKNFPRLSSEETKI